MMYRENEIISYEKEKKFILFYDDKYEILYILVFLFIYS
jgi:hypothetical protein